MNWCSRGALEGRHPRVAEEACAIGRPPTVLREPATGSPTESFQTESVRVNVARNTTSAAMSGPRRVAPPVFYPTLEEMNTMSLERYVESIEEQLEEYGIGRIVPPKGWIARKQGYEDIDFTVHKAITQHATGRKGLFRTLLVEKKPLSVAKDFKPLAEKPENQPSKSALEDPTHGALEREFWKKVAYDPPTYCADVAGTLFDNDGEGGVTDGWDISRLDSLLSRTLKEKNITLDGVNSSYLYFGMWRSLFAWHTEDCDLYSVNYLHYGAPKYWYAVAPEDRERFEILAQGMVPEMWRACPEFLRHKELLISPTLLEQNGIPFTRVMQHPGEFVVTYPGSYHSGFNCGYNCAESCNFATEAWVEIGEDAGTCECVPDAVSLDMRIFGDLCTRCHDADEREEESEEETETTTTLARVEGVGGKRESALPSRHSANRAAAADDDDDDDGVSVSGTTGEARRGEAPLVPDGPSKSAPWSGSRGGDANAATRVKVPEGWTRSVVMRGPDGAPPLAGPGRPKSAAGDRDTYYTSPEGIVVKSKYEVVKYLQKRPRDSESRATEWSPRDFYFESRPEDSPPARLSSPSTPSPTASSERPKGRRRAVLSEAKNLACSPNAKDSDSKLGSKRNRLAFFSSRDAEATAAAKRGGEGTDALEGSRRVKPTRAVKCGSLKPNGTGTSNGVSVSKRSAVKVNPVELGVHAKPLKPLASFRSASGEPVGAETFGAWTAGGSLERAVAKVLRRAGSVRKYAHGIRGSSLVTQVERALGVGSGTLRKHGVQIQSLARSKRATQTRETA